MNFIFKIITSALAVIVCTYFLPGVSIDEPLTAIILAAVLAFLDAIVKPVMVILTIPVTVMSLGLFLLVINAGMILFADYLVQGFEVDGFWYALLFSLILSIVTGIFNGFARNYESRNEEE